MAKAKKISDALQIIDRVIGDDAELLAIVDEERAGAEIAQLIYDARARAGLTKKELAELLGKKQPAIARLEDSEYDGHSVGMLCRIATALHMRLEIRLIPDQEAA